MRSGHLLVALLHSAEERSVTVLLVHVVRAGAGVVAQLDAVVLHLLVLLVNLPRSRPNRYLVHGEDLTGSLLLLQSVHEIPVAGLGRHRVGSEQSHSVNLRLRIHLGGQSAANDLVVVNLRRAEKSAPPRCATRITTHNAQTLQKKYPRISS